MASGGARTGTPGVAYPNRTDMTASAGTQPATAPTGQPYGQHGQQIAAQQAIPLPAFDAPTGRPNEPVTAGLNSGPGPTAAEAGIPGAPGSKQSVSEQLRAIFTVYPTDDLADMIAALDETMQ